MSEHVCPRCGGSMDTDQSCPKCSLLTAIALPEAAARVKTTPSATSDGAFLAGLPPMPVPAAQQPRQPLLTAERVIFWTISLGVVATIVALLVPALQKVREAAARTQSTNNLKQIGLAALSFHDANRRLPFNGSAVAVNEVSYSLEAKPGQFTSGSWGFQIISYIDQSPVFNDGTSNFGIAAYMCPGRGRPTTSSTPAVGAATPPWSDYVINAWIDDARFGNSDAPDFKRTLVGITDGTSNTVFVGHGQIRPADYRTTEATPGYLDTILRGGSTATALSSNPRLGPVTLAMDSAGTRTDAARGFGSPFAQGALMCMCDATVRMFPYSMGVGAFAGDGDAFGYHDASAAPREGLLIFLTPTGSETVVIPDT